VLIEIMIGSVGHTENHRCDTEELCEMTNSHFSPKLFSKQRFREDVADHRILPPNDKVVSLVALDEGVGSGFAP
jgi:hypothetical protein